jgi:hypothetical protein
MKVVYALALAMAALAATTVPGYQAEVLETEVTYFVPVYLRGVSTPYLLSMTSAHSYDVEYPLLQQQQQQQSNSKVPKDMVYTFFEGGGDEDVDHVAIVSYFDETDTIDPKKSLREGGDSSGENATSEVEEKQLVKLLEEAAEAEEKEALADTVDLFWLQEQIDLLSHFESSLSLDNVHRHSSGRKGCNKKMKQTQMAAQDPNRHHQQQQQNPLRRKSSSEEDGDRGGDSHSALGVPQELMSLLVEDHYYPSEDDSGTGGEEDSYSYITVFWDQWIGELDEADAFGKDEYLPLYHPGSIEHEQKDGSGSNSVLSGSSHGTHSGKDVGIIVLSIIITCLYCVAVFGAIYLVLLLLNFILVSVWSCVFGRCGSSQNTGDEDADEEVEVDVEEQQLDAPLLGGEGYPSSSDTSSHVNPLSAFLQPLGPEPAAEPTYVADLPIMDVVKNPSYRG